MKLLPATYLFASPTGPAGTPLPAQTPVPAQDTVLAHLNARGFVQFHPVLAARLDSLKGAVFLGHALYWSRHLARHEPQRRGWFFMTARQWQEATALSTREQAAVRAALVAHGLLQEALAGHPAKLHFKVNLAAVMQLAGFDSGAPGTPLSWELLTPLFKDSVRFYKPLADIAGSLGAGLYLSHLLQIARHALQQGQDSPFLAPGEFLIRPEDVRIALGLGPKAQRNARDKLKAAGLLAEGRAYRERQAVRLNLAAIVACVESQPHTRLPQRAPRLKSDPARLGLVPAGTPPVARRLDRPGRQMGMFGSAMPLAAAAGASLDSRPGSLPPDEGASPSPWTTVMRMFAGTAGSTTPPAADVTPVSSLAAGDRAPHREFALLSKLNCPFVETALPFCRNIQGIARIKTTTTTTVPVTAPMAVEPDPGRRRDLESLQEEQGLSQRLQGAEAAGEPGRVAPFLASVAPDHVVNLVMPRTLHAQWHAAVHRALSAVTTDSRQLLLDELAGQLEAPGKVIHNPPGWLLGLAKRFAQGTAVLALADKVRADRESRIRYEQAYAQALEQGTPQLPPNESAAESPEALARRQAELEKLRAVRAKLSAGRSA